MAQFVTLTIETDIDKLIASNAKPEDKVAAARKILNDQTKLAVANFKAYVTGLTDSQMQAKSALEDMARRLRTLQDSPVPDMYAVPTIKAGLDVIEHLQAGARKLNLDHTAAIMEFRSGNWPTKVRALTDGAGSGFTLEGYTEMRKKIINDSQAELAKLKRVEEYKQRALSVIADAEKAGKQGASQVEDAKKLSTDIVHRAATAQSELVKIEPSLKIYLTQVKGKIDERLRNDMQGTLKKLQADLKNARGSQKTLGQEQDRLLKMAKEMGSLGKSLVDPVSKALDAFGDRITAVTGQVDTLEKGLKKK